MPTHTRGQALDELAILARDIANYHLQIAELFAAEHEAKITSWFNADSQYVSERDRIADFNSLNLSIDLIKLRGELSAAEAMRDYYQAVVHWGPTV